MVRTPRHRDSGRGWHNQSDRHRLARMGIKTAVKDSPESRLKIMKPKELSEKQKQNKFYEDYIIESISSEGYDVDLKTKKEKLQFLKDTFKSEYGHAISTQGEQKAFQNWIQGLPSSFNIEFYNHEILQLAKKSGSLPQNATEKQEDKVLSNYWQFMTVHTFKAFKKYGVE